MEKSANLVWMTSTLRFVFALALIGLTAGADTHLNPYLSIVDRNPFGIKPLPPPAPTIEAPPPVPLAKVILTGVTSIIGPPRALLEITEQEPGKAPVVSKQTLKEGERAGSIEVLNIDVQHTTVRIRNGTVETNVVFEVAKQIGPAGPQPMVPPSTAPPSVATPSFSSASASPMIFSSGAGDRANTGVTLMGGANSPSASPTATSPSSYGNNPGYQMASAGVSTYGAGGVSRPIRTDQRAGSERQVPLDENIGRFLKQAEIANQNGGLIPYTDTKPNPKNPRGGWILPPLPGMDSSTPGVPTPQ